MPLYFWSNVNELADYAPGYAIVLADDLLTAVEVAVSERKRDIEEMHPGHSEVIEFGNRLRKELQETKPEIYGNNTAILITGSA